MRKLFLAMMAVAAIALTGCEKGKDEPEQKSSKENGHEWVDLGLPSGIKWATCNVGATKPEEYGGYFAWGETSPKTTYDWITYFDTQNNGSTFIKYNNDGGKTVLDLADDAAHVNWGGSWRMPTKEEQDELRTKCTWTWTQKNGINGYEVKGLNDNSIFLPAAGMRYLSVYDNVGTDGDYWASSLYSGGSYYACYLDFDSNNKDWDYDYRNYGQSIRPVCK